jgi:hypothetical protein
MCAAGRLGMVREQSRREAPRIANNCPENRRANDVYMGDKYARISLLYAKELFGRANRNC